ncbi:MAG TPA: tryptophan-rich sensory protein [Candidatus Krumholzibacteria bacterium]|nr:tryptophan-rich sensory protein [Candidatus Krumholzibacteria bacterium]
MSPAILALIICMVSAVLEGVMAGRGVRSRFRELRLPSYSPPMKVWSVIGIAYYLICYVILYRLLGAGVSGQRHQAAFLLLMVLMVVNAGWGYLFFRRKDLRASFLVFVPYGALALVLAFLLAGIDRASALLLILYLGYLAYAAWWAYRVWRLNHDPE